MKWLNGIVLAACLAFPLPTFGVAVAETAAMPAKTAAAPSAGDDKDGDLKTSETDKRAKASECSKQADAKKLHGEARKKFRSACKRGK